MKTLIDDGNGDICDKMIINMFHDGCGTEERKEICEIFLKFALEILPIAKKTTRGPLILQKLHFLRKDLLDSILIDSVLHANTVAGTLSEVEEAYSELLKKMMENQNHGN
jgi:hypothetical protein